MKPEIYGSVLFGADALVADWVTARIPAMIEQGRQFRDFAALGIVGPAGLSGGVVFTAWRGHDVEVSGAVDPGFRCTPATLRLVLAYAFGQLGCVRLSMTIARHNRAARRFAERLGFRVEGVKRRGWDGRHDAILYGLQRAECRFLTRSHNHG